MEKYLKQEIKRINKKIDNYSVLGSSEIEDFNELCILKEKLEKELDILKREVK